MPKGLHGAANELQRERERERERKEDNNIKYSNTYYKLYNKDLH